MAPCLDGVCSRVFEQSSSSCNQSSDIAVTVSATNKLGDGPPSDLFNIGKPVGTESTDSTVTLICAVFDGH